MWLHSRPGTFAMSSQVELNYGVVKSEPGSPGVMKAIAYRFVAQAACRLHLNGLAPSRAPFAKTTKPTVSGVRTLFKA